MISQIFKTRFKIKRFISSQQLGQDTAKKGVLFNTSAQLASRVISSIFIFLSTVLIARTLGSQKYGEYTKVISYLSIFYVFSDFGMNTVFLRMTKKNVGKKLGTFFSLRLLWGAGLALIAVVGMWWLSRVSAGFTPLVFLGVLIGSWSIFVLVGQLSTMVVFQAQMRYDRVAIAQTAGSAAMFAILVLFYQFLISSPKLGVIIALLTMIAGGLVTTWISLWLIQAWLNKIKLNIDKNFWKRMLLASFPLGLAMLFNSIYFRSGILILAAYRSSFEVGAYGLAFKFFEFMLAIPTYFMNSIYPVLIDEKISIQKNRKGIKAIISGLFVASCVIGVLLWFGSPLLSWIRSDFATSVNLLKVMSLVLPLFFLTSPMMWLFVLAKKQNLLIYIYGAASLFNIIANILFIPKYGAVGTIMVLAVTELLTLCLGGSLFFKRVYAKL